MYKVVIITLNCFLSNSTRFVSKVWTIRLDPRFDTNWIRLHYIIVFVRWNILIYLGFTFVNAVYIKLKLITLVVASYCLIIVHTYLSTKFIIITLFVHQNFQLCFHNWIFTRGHPVKINRLLNKENQKNEFCLLKLKKITKQLASKDKLVKLDLELFTIFFFSTKQRKICFCYKSNSRGQMIFLFFFTPRRDDLFPFAWLHNA